jgi:hypothetical protein
MNPSAVAQPDCINGCERSPYMSPAGACSHPLYPATCMPRSRRMLRAATQHRPCPWLGSSWQTAAQTTFKQAPAALREFMGPGATRRSGCAGLLLLSGGGPALAGSTSPPSPPWPPHLLGTSFSLTNHRADVVFRLLRNGTTLPGKGTIVVEGTSSVVINAIRDAPSQGHLALDAEGR